MKEEKVLMPKELTHKNNSKTFVMGKYYELLEITDEDGNDYTQKVYVSWSTIKQIYQDLVSLHGETK